MAFLFKSKKNQDREKDRNLTSRDGPAPSSQPPSITSASARLLRDEKTSLQRSTPTGSLNSVENDGSGSPDQSTYARRPPIADQMAVQQQPPSDAQFRNGPGPTMTNPNTSLYPWSQRRLTYTASNLSPFPRYGAAVNSAGSREGDIYVMGGLINSQTVKGDLWIIEAGGNLSCYQVTTTAENPSPRVGHASLLVGNAFIVYGGDTKIDESDILDETLYLLNTSSKQWSRALPAGPRPCGRYGHSLNILGSKIYIFGGQVEGHFMNDLAAFDLNQLQKPSNRWEMLIPNSDSGGPPQGKIPPARTNHSMVSYNDKMYLFGGTNGFQWFNDVWCYDPVDNMWTQLDCIGYIPVEREGHAAALVDDVMYIFGGRTDDGSDLGDLAAFRISSRRWYTFQNMGPSPSPRSGHSMTTVGKSVVVLGGEPSSPSPAGTVNDLSLVYVLDTNKIRYPNDAQAQSSSQKNPTARRPSDTTRSPTSRDGSQGPGDSRQRLIGPGAVNSPTNGYRSPASEMNGSTNSASPVSGPSKVPRSAGTSPPVGPPPQMQPPRPSQSNATVSGAFPRTRNLSSEKVDYTSSPAVNSNVSQVQPPTIRETLKDVDSPTINGRRTPTQQQAVKVVPKIETSAPATAAPLTTIPTTGLSSDSASPITTAPAAAPPAPMAAPAAPRSKPSRGRGAGSMDSTNELVSKTNMAANNRPSSPPPPTRQTGGNPLSRRSSGRNSQTVALLKELDSARNRNAWYASELELARKAGYVPNATLSPVLDGRATEVFDDDDKPLIEALLAMRAELANVQNSVDKQAILAARQIAEAEKQRDAAIQEAVYSKAKLAALIGNGSVAGSPQLDGDRDVDGRVGDMSHKLASALNAQRDLQARLERMTAEVEAEKRARQLADDTAAATQRRMTELENYKQQTSYEMESVKAELHTVRRDARDQYSKAAEAVASLSLIRVEKESFERQYNEVKASAKEKGDTFESLRSAMLASSEMKTLLEQKLEQERAQHEDAQAKLVKVKAELEARTTEVIALTQRLRDTEEIAEKHANEARTHRQAVLSGLDSISTRDVSSSMSNRADADRIVALQGQLTAAKALVEKHQQDADTALERLRSAEERIAGLEAYQEQSSREGVTIRRQLQAALRETQSLQALSTDLKHQLSNQQRETNAVAVQHNTLKDILSERGISPTSAAAASRSRGSPRETSPEQEARIRGLEQQLAAATSAHEETKQAFAAQASDSENMYRDKLAQLENDYQSAVEYVHAMEKALKQLKEELTRYKSENSRLKSEVEELEGKTAAAEAEAAAAAASGGAAGAASAEAARAGWDAEREALSQKIEALQADLLSSKAQLEKQMQAVQRELEVARSERDSAKRSNEETSQRLTSSRRELEQLWQENSLLERRAQDAEQKVSLLLDQVETSVGNYRRRSRQVASMNSDQLRDAAAAPIPSAMTAAPTTMTTSTTTATTTNGNGAGATGGGHSRQDSSDTGSAYGGSVGGARNSMALDSLANELETLRSHWEATNKNYRLSNAFDFDTGSIGNATSTGGNGSNGATAGKDGKDENGGLGLSESLADWRKRLDG